MNELRRIDKQLNIAQVGLDRENDSRLLRNVADGLTSLPVLNEGSPGRWESPDGVNHASPKDTDRFPQSEIRYSLTRFHVACTPETCPYVKHMRALLYKLIKTGEESGSLVSQPKTYSFIRRAPE